MNEEEERGAILYSATNSAHGAILKFRLSPPPPSPSATGPPICEGCQGKTGLYHLSPHCSPLPLLNFLLHTIDCFTDCCSVLCENCSSHSPLLHTSDSHTVLITPWTDKRVVLKWENKFKLIQVAFQHKNLWEDPRSLIVLEFSANKNVSVTCTWNIFQSLRTPYPNVMVLLGGIESDCYRNSNVKLTIQFVLRFNYTFIESLLYSTHCTRRKNKN